MRKAQKATRLQLALQRSANTARTSTGDMSEGLQGSPIPELERQRGLSLEDVADIIQDLPRPLQAESTERQKVRHFRYFLKYLIVLDLKEQGGLPNEESECQQVINARVNLYLEKLQKKEFDSALQSTSFWVVYLHQFGVKGQGQMNPENAAHTNTPKTIFQVPHPDNPHIQVALDMDNLHREAASIIHSLKPPASGDSPVTLRTICDMFHTIIWKLKLDFGTKIESDVYDKVMEVLRYNAVRLNWYPTSEHVKLWVTEDQIKLLLAGVWRLKFRALSSFDDALFRLNIHTLLQLLDLTGIRQSSLLDTNRQQGQVGIYLRWHHLDISLVSYTDDDQPIFVVFGNVPPSKVGTTIPYLKSMPFTAISTKHNEEFSVDRDPVIGLISIAILQNSCGPDLLRVIEDSAYGKQLLSKSSDGIYTFRYQSGFLNSPVFSKKSTMLQKHTSDSCPLGQYKPMHIHDLQKQLTALGERIGFHEPLSYSQLRRSYNMKMVMKDSFPSWRLCLNMGHDTTHVRLHRHVYRSSMRPLNILLQRFGRPCISEVAESAISQLGSISFRPDRSLFEPEKLESIKQLVSSYLRACYDEEDGTSTIQCVTDEDIIRTYQEINGGIRKGLQESLAGLKKFVDDDDWSTLIKAPHPFLESCNNKLSDVVAWLIARSKAKDIGTFVPFSNTL